MINDYTRQWLFYVISFLKNLRFLGGSVKCKWKNGMLLYAFCQNFPSFFEFVLRYSYVFISIFLNLKRWSLRVQNQFFLIIHSIVLSSIDRFPSDQKWGEKEKGNIGEIDSRIKETKNLKTQMENVLRNTIRITGIVKL